MRLVTLLALAGVSLGFLAAPASAHHSTNNIYHEDQTVEITAVVKEWRLVNPHPFLIVEVEGEDGALEEWDVSFGGSAAGPLRRQGYTPDTFSPGEVIIVRGNPARAEDYHGILVRGGLRREDGSPIP